MINEKQVQALKIYRYARRFERDCIKLRKEGLEAPALIAETAARALYEEYDRALGTKPPRVVARSLEVPF